MTVKTRTLPRAVARLKVPPVIVTGCGYAVTMVDPDNRLSPTRRATIVFRKRTKYRILGMLNGHRISLGYKQLALLATGRHAGITVNDHVWLVTIVERTPDIAAHLASVA